LPVSPDVDVAGGVDRDSVGIAQIRKHQFLSARSLPPAASVSARTVCHEVHIPGRVHRDVAWIP
jgi:hypothetical protein